MIKKTTGLLTDPIYLQHQTGLHPEKPERLTATLEKLQSSSIWGQLKIIPAKMPKPGLIELVHDSDYISELERKITSGVDYVYSPDCTVSAETFKVAQNAAGGALSLVDHLLDGEISNGFGLIRPPGHHAEQKQAMGFCYFNNIAICAEYLIQHQDYKRILIMDFDVHHGNGTQHFFESRSDVYYCSIHESPQTCFPGTGYQSEKGIGAGIGYTLNMAMNAGVGDTVYAEVLENVFMPAWESFKPEFVLISAGFDAHYQDPLASIEVTNKSFVLYTKALCDIAERFCQGKLLSLLEGGYNLKVMPELIESHISVLLDSVTG
ncbi:MAG: histone deacetylase [Deltaproteobacteria bacterium]|jgi:acetoin utilization deacetylase AcuC-like enzyme|nr:histone deacetylase [Deltaproteobacteria bacterium]MBT4526207.1 histone deacetylase [Deltaproteobacteria bacterium]